MSKSPQVKLSVPVYWKDKKIWFERIAPTLPSGVCWMVGMTLWEDEAEFEIESISVDIDGSVTLWIDDVKCEYDFSDDEFQEWIDAGWEGKK